MTLPPGHGRTSSDPRRAQRSGTFGYTDPLNVDSEGRLFVQIDVPLATRDGKLGLVLEPGSALRIEKGRLTFTRVRAKESTATTVDALRADLNALIRALRGNVLEA